MICTPESKTSHPSEPSPVPWRHTFLVSLLCRYISLIFRGASRRRFKAKAEFSLQRGTHLTGRTRMKILSHKRQGAVGVVVSRPLSMREALGSIPRLSMHLSGRACSTNLHSDCSHNLRVFRAPTYTLNPHARCVHRLFMQALKNPREMNMPCRLYLHRITSTVIPLQTHQSIEHQSSIDDVE